MSYRVSYQVRVLFVIRWHVTKGALFKKTVNNDKKGKRGIWGVIWYERLFLRIQLSVGRRRRVLAHSGP